jgi:hypothetical protein
MTKTASDRTLAALFAPEGDDDNTRPAEQALPTLNERVELFLRAVHGPESEFTAQQRNAARARIVDAMAAYSTDDIDAADNRRAASADEQRLATNLRSDLRSDSVNAKAAVREHIRSGLVARLFESLLLPLTALTASPRRRFAIASLAVLAIAAVGWSGAWFYGARTAQTAIALWIDGEAQSGRDYRCGSQTVSGFPLRIEMRCTEPSVKVASDQSSITADAKEIRAVASILRPTAWSVEITGPLSISNRNQPIFLANWTTAHVALSNGPTNPDRVSVAFDGAQFYRVAQNSMQPLLTSDRLEAEAHVSPTPANGMSIVDISTHVAGGYLAVNGPLPSQPFVADATAALTTGIPDKRPELLSARLRQWQASGGSLEIKSARIQQGDANAVAQGNLGLNGDGRVEGTLRASIAGTYVQFAETIIRDAADRNRIAEAAQSNPQIRTRSIGELSGPPRPDNAQPAPATALSTEGKNSADLPIRFVNGTVYFGSTLIGSLPPFY